MANIVEITDFSAPELDVYARLTEAQLLNRFEPAKGMFIAESPKVIHRALDGGCVPVSLLMERKDIEGSAKEIIERCGDIPVFTADEDLLCNLTGYHLTRGVLCAMRRPQLPTARELLKNINRVAILENVMNPTNVGAIFRSGAADPRLLQSPVPPQRPGKHGHGVPDPLGLYWRRDCRLARRRHGTAERNGLQDRRPGADRRFRFH